MEPEDMPIAAFPSVFPKEYDYGNVGMSLRDYIAISVMQGDAANPSAGAFSALISEKALEAQTRLYYRIADAMLKAREEEE